MGNSGRVAALKERSVLRSKVNRLLPLGLLMLASGLIVHNFIHAAYTESTAGLLIGMASVFMIAGFVAKMRTG
jgi:hypothetical protein